MFPPGIPRWSTRLVHQMGAYKALKALGSAHHYSHGVTGTPGSKALCKLRKDPKFSNHLVTVLTVEESKTFIELNSSTLYSQAKH